MDGLSNMLAGLGNAIRELTCEIRHQSENQKILCRIDQSEIKIMSAISDWSVKFGQKLDKIQTGLDAVQALVEKLQTSPGAITPEDQATLDQLDAKVDAIAADADSAPPPLPSHDSVSRKCGCGWWRARGIGLNPGHNRARQTTAPGPTAGGGYHPPRGCAPSVVLRKIVWPWRGLAPVFLTAPGVRCHGSPSAHRRPCPFPLRAGCGYPPKAPIDSQEDFPCNPRPKRLEVGA